MSSMELEVKILNIDKENIVNKITNAGGKYISSSKQYLCVYDLMYINQRYYADLYELNNEILESRKDIVLAKIKNLFYEVDQLMDSDDVELLDKNFKISNLSEMFTFDKERILELVHEGHRFFDARRLGKIISVADGSYTNFNIAKFVYPIPSFEVNSGFGVIQTEGWSNNLPR